MAKKVWKPGTFVYPIPAALITSGDMENSNILTVAWTGIMNTNPAIVYISVRPERYSYNLIKANKEFAINLTNRELAYATDWCGVRSGANFDKFKEMNLTKEKANFIKAPLIKESPVSVECKVIEEKNYGSHTTFIAEVLSIDADEKYMDESGAFDISKCDLIAYANGGYYELGEKIGKFGYSVDKNKSKEKKASDFKAKKNPQKNKDLNLNRNTKKDVSSKSKKDINKKEDFRSKRKVKKTENTNKNKTNNPNKSYKNGLKKANNKRK